MTSRLVRLQRAGFLVQSAVLAAAVVVASTPLVLLGYGICGQIGGVAALVAAWLCFLGAEVALVVCHLLRPTPFRQFGFLAGMLPRMGIPLVFGLFFCVTVPPVAKAGLMLYLIALYPVVLTVETIESLPVREDPAGLID